MRSRISRRTVLKGLLGGAAITVGLPPLEAFMNSTGTAYADGGGFPVRFGLFFWGNGIVPERWTPKSEGKGWEPSDELMPLKELRDEISVVSGMALGVPNTAPHFAGAAGILSGSPVQDAYGENTFGTPSIDQVAAAVLGESTRFRSLELGAEHGGGLSYNGPSSRNPPEGSPIALFERVFGKGFSLPGDKPIVDPTLGLRRSILDSVSLQIGKLKGRVGKADAVRLDQHFEGIRSLEKRLAKLEESPPNLAACKYAPMPEGEYPDVEGRPKLQEKNKAFADIVAYALACDQTRVFSNWFTHPVNNLLFTGAPAGHHQLTHDEPDPQEEVHKIVVQCIEGYKVQLEALRAVQEGDGTLLDHCAVLGTSDVSLGKTHSLEDFPILIAGSASGRLKKGIHYHSPAGENASRVLLSILRAVGAAVPSFGTEGGMATEGFSAIEV